MSKLSKYYDHCSDIELSDTNDTEALGELLKEYNECQAFVDSVLTSFAKIDSSINDFINDSWNFASSFLERAGRESEKRNPNMSRFVTDALIGAGAAVGGLAIGGYRKIKAKKERRRQLDEAMVVKQKIADEKYDLIVERLRKMNEGLLPKIERLYEKESSKTVCVDDELLFKRIQLFKQSFVLYIKSRFLEGSLLFVLAEMDAWKMGKDDSDFKKLSINDYVEKELLQWPEKIGDCDDWDQFIYNQLESSETNIPIQTAFVLSEPALVSRYVGVQINDFGNCIGPVYVSHDSSYFGERASKFILENNSYIKDCISIAKEYHNDPKPKEKFSWIDLLSMLIIPAVVCFFGIKISMYFHSWFWRIVFGLLIAFVFFILFSSFEYYNKKKGEYRKIGLDLYERLVESSLPYVRINQKLDNNQKYLRRQAINQERELRNKYNII